MIIDAPLSKDHQSFVQMEMLMESFTTQRLVTSLVKPLAWNIHQSEIMPIGLSKSPGQKNWPRPRYLLFSRWRWSPSKIIFFNSCDNVIWVIIKFKINHSTLNQILQKLFPLSQRIWVEQNFWAFIWVFNWLDKAYLTSLQNFERLFYYSYFSSDSFVIQGIIVNE